jgi:hypothetical protein
MEKMFSECKGGNCPTCNELDTYLKLQRMNPNNNFSQMSQSRKFGFGKGRGRAGSQGEGAMGMSGYAVKDGSALNVVGNESSPREGKTSRQSSRFGKGTGTLAAGAAGTKESPSGLSGLNPVNRQSGAVASEAIVEEYNEVVENYFKAITTGRGKPSNEP